MAKAPPRVDLPDSTLSFLMQGYDFISQVCEKKKSDIVQTRLLLQKFICMKGEEAARTFYDSSRFERRRAAPERLKRTGEIPKG